MTPIDRVRRRAMAASKLNVSLYSTREELKEAWRCQVRLTHPDRNEGNEREFRAMKTAYEILMGTAEEDAVIETAEVDEGPSIRPKRVVSRERSRTQRPT